MHLYHLQLFVFVFEKSIIELQKESKRSYKRKKKVQMASEKWRKIKTNP